MIVYGVMSQTSVLKLFTAGIVPGFLLTACFMTFIAVLAKVKPTRVPAATGDNSNIWREHLQGMPSLLPFLILIGSILGSMYGGIASPTEAAAVAVVVTIVLMAIERSLTWSFLKDATVGTARTISMLGLIIATASFLASAIGFLGMPQAVSAFINGLNLPPLGLIALLMVVHIVLGSFLEGMSIIVMTIPIVMPLVVHAGYDKIWLGVFLILMVELAQISPPVGMNLFVLQGLTDRPLSSVVRAAFPFFVIMLCFVYFLAVVPKVVSLLPNLL
ncbi:TRAP transporter large permease subunit [Breoghania sp.]|uniref:TRAP transporter large permease subunit n=1 Tax=Breoghania sp. TaxID=2065378 RepID=UPI002613C722|nr:TRAP transporter large permease subunit [Breoghania sp.]MDJ0930714.1 TRAP transporter large permease subunit [Breoghania sp.]